MGLSCYHKEILFLLLYIFTYIHTYILFLLCTLKHTHNYIDEELEGDYDLGQKNASKMI